MAAGHKGLVRNKIAVKLLVILIVLLLLYGLMWVVYAAEHNKAQKAILGHYGGVGNTCGEAASIPGILSLAPRSVLLPIEGVSYTITTSGGGTASGYVSPVGKVQELHDESCFLNR